MQKIKEIVYVPITKVVRDEEQPRQFFDPIKLGRLSDSIKKMGIKEPLTVEQMSDGTYKIVDGERRWRSARAIGLKELPVLVEKGLSPSDRLIEQFHLQEMREGWRADEKAIAINSLAQVLGVTFTEAAKMAGLNKKVAEGYSALIGLRDRETFLSHGLPIERAQNVLSLIKTAKHQTRKQVSEEMTEEDAEQLEKVLVSKLVSGELKNNDDILALKDAIIKDVKNVGKFIKGESAVKLFKASDASGARSYRRLKNMMINLNSLVKQVAHSKDAMILLEEDAGLRKYIKTNIKLLDSIS